MPVSMKEISYTTKTTVRFAIGYLGICLPCRVAEGLRFGVLMGILFSLVHFLLEFPGFLLVYKRKSG